MKIIQPEVGDTKTCSGFAFFPTKIDRVTTVWLEFYTRHKIYLAFNSGVFRWVLYDLANNQIYYRGHWQQRERTTMRGFIPVSNNRELPEADQIFWLPPLYPVEGAVKEAHNPIKKSTEKPKNHIGRKEFMERQMK